MLCLFVCLFGWLVCLVCLVGWLLGRLVGWIGWCDESSWKQELPLGQLQIPSPFYTPWLKQISFTQSRRDEPPNHHQGEQAAYALMGREGKAFFLVFK